VIFSADCTRTTCTQLLSSSNVKPDCTAAEDGRNLQRFIEVVIVTGMLRVPVMFIIPVSLNDSLSKIKETATTSLLP